MNKVSVHFPTFNITLLSGKNRVERATVDSNRYDGYWKNPGSIDSTYCFTDYFYHYFTYYHF